MKAALMGIGWLLSSESIRAENSVIRSITTAPPYRTDGPLVSVIIIAYNEESYLPALLSALPNQTHDNLEIIVVDNMSTDRTVDIAHSMGATVCFNEEYNLSRSRNIGAANSSGDILCFIDADTIPEHIAIECAVGEIKKGAVLVMPNKCSTDSHIQSLLRVGSGWALGHPISIAGVNGQFMCMSREVFDSVSGFDETCLAQEGCGEDVELARDIAEVYGWDRVKLLRTVYAGTSARRQKAEGYVVPQHFQQRAIRGSQIEPISY